MELLRDILDNDEKIFWMKELSRRTILPFYYDKKGKKRRTNKRIQNYYEVMKVYRSDKVLEDYPIILTLTNKHIIRHEVNDYDYPLWYGECDISHIYEYRNEFCFYNLNELTDICKNINPKRNKYELGLYFDLNEKYMGDDAPNVWLDNLSKKDYKEILEFLLRIVPHVKIDYLFKKQEKYEKDLSNEPIKDLLPSYLVKEEIKKSESCKFCNEKVNADAIFCPNCGNKIDPNYFISKD
ncbi:MAG: hypothetical protein ACFFDK_06815 [Promethearchaeota archaeon]